MLMKPLISGRRINNCMPIQAPNEKPPTQVVCASGLNCCIQSSALAASLNSPMPLSNTPWLRPTPRKLKRSVAKPRLTKLLYIAITIGWFIVPCAGCGCSRMATGARGRLAGW